MFSSLFKEQFRHTFFLSFFLFFPSFSPFPDIPIIITKSNEAEYSLYPYFDFIQETVFLKARSIPSNKTFLFCFQLKPIITLMLFIFPFQSYLISPQMRFQFHISNSSVQPLINQQSVPLSTSKPPTPLYYLLW